MHTVVVCTLRSRLIYRRVLFFNVSVLFSHIFWVEVGIFKLLHTPVMQAGGTEGGDELSVRESHFMDTVFTDYTADLCIKHDTLNNCMTFLFCFLFWNFVLLQDVLSPIIFF